MRKYLHILLIVSLFTLTGCHDSDPDVFFTESNTIGLVDEGKFVVQYDPLTWQMSFNRSHKQFKAFDDKMKEKYSVTFSAIPTQIDQTITCNVTWTSEGRMKNVGKMDFRVCQTDGKGTWWLWNKSKKHLGISVWIPEDL